MTAFDGGRNEWPAERLAISGCITAGSRRQMAGGAARIIHILVGIGFAVLVWGALVALP